MDTTIIAALVVVVGALLSVFHINYAGDLTVLITSVVTLVAAATVWYQRTTLTKAIGGDGDVKASGFKRNNG